MAVPFNKPETACILTINGGSSSIKFALYTVEPSLDCRVKGEIERIGPAGGHMVVTDTPDDRRYEDDLDVYDHVSAAHYLIDWLEERVGFESVYAVGHRVVHGMQYDAPQRITPALLEELHRISPYDPDHLPVEIELMETFGRRHPKLPQVACFDTSFHRTMPRVARLMPIPRRYDADGIQRYGFHGLSFAYLMETLNRTAASPASKQPVDESSWPIWAAAPAWPRSITVKAWTPPWDSRRRPECPWALVREIWTPAYSGTGCTVST